MHIPLLMLLSWWHEWENSNLWNTKNKKYLKLFKWNNPDYFHFFYKKKTSWKHISKTVLSAGDSCFVRRQHLLGWSEGQNRQKSGRKAVTRERWGENNILVLVWANRIHQAGCQVRQSYITVNIIMILLSFVFLK